MSAVTLEQSAGNRAARRAAEAKKAQAVADIFGDFPSFCALLEIKLKSGGTLPFNYERWNGEQKKFQRARHKSRRHIVVKPRQIGFSTLELARDLWFALTRKAVAVLVVVHDEAIKKRLFRDLKRMALALQARGLLPKMRNDTVDEIVFADTGSSVAIIEAGATDRSAEGKGRSGTIHRLHATEMAFWKAAETTWTALDAAVPPDGEVTIESTANGAGGLFYELVQANRTGKGQYAVHFFPWFEHREYRAPAPHDFDPKPRNKWEQKLRANACNDQQISWWRYKVDDPAWGLDKTLQEYPVDADSCFRVSGRQYFSADVIDELFEKVREPLRTQRVAWSGLKGDQPPRELGELLVFAEPKRGAEYVIGGDVSEGTGSDASAFPVMERESAQIVATFWSDATEPGDFGLAMAVVGHIYNEAMVAPERNNHGHAALRALTHEAEYRNLYQTEDGKAGWSTDVKTRPIMVDDLGTAIRTGLVSTPDRRMASECKTLVRNDRGKVEARGKGVKGAAKDDTFLGWCISFQVRNAPRFTYAPIKIPGL